MNSNACDSQLEYNNYSSAADAKLAQYMFLPSVQDHHGHLGVLLQPGENCLSRGFHFCLSATLYLAQDSP